MTSSRILITGATGFIGSRLCERMKLHYKLPFSVLVRNFTRANRIARLDASMVSGDLRRPESISSALKGCTAVVHLAFTDGEFAVEETNNLLAACRTSGIGRLVHVSSMAVHGPYPGPECAREETATIGRYGNPYSDAKAAVEETVQAAVKRGFPAVILRPTIVYGPYSGFVMSAVERARRGEISLIDEGNGICNAVYVDDVCDAIFAAVHSDEALGQAMFVNADAPVTWRDFNVLFGQMVRPAPVIRNYAGKDLRAYWEARRPTWKTNLKALTRLPLSPDLHRQLATVPAFDRLLRWAKGTLKGMLTEQQIFALQSRTRRSTSGKTGFSSGGVMPDEGRLRRETFPIHFSNERAKSLLNWKPAYDFPRGVSVTRTWLEFSRQLEAVE